MRVKKLLALLLSGMVLAGCLSGCDRTIIEHQFHTNTVTDTEYIEIGSGSGVGGSEFNLSFAKLENFLIKSKGQDSIFFNIVRYPSTFRYPISELTEDVEEAKKPLKDKIQLIFNSDTKSIEYLKAYEYGLDNFYMELSNVCDELYNCFSDTTIVNQDMWNELGDSEWMHLNIIAYDTLDEVTGEPYIYYSLFFSET